jgi:L-lactate dehydrogenase complex protein LldG
LAQCSSLLRPRELNERGADELLNEFREKAEPLGVVVHREATVVGAAHLAAEWAASLGADGMVISNQLEARWPEFRGIASGQGLTAELPTSAEEVRDAPAGVTLARMAIAETGSTLLAEAVLADRAVSMLTLAVVIVCPTSSLVASLDDAAPELRRLALESGGSFATLLTGPSRTADIERVLTVGVQGPGKVLVVFVDE